ncbi:hypothetical protein [Moheibacter lacus]|uniref:Peptidylprolyl isomerase n=1 Tax=Moheibacter lacus TaxID=2745851 RepID=A0A838ZKQ8_9FLAO|nr:hypothetical protein [Moheibacter lacus]MBA5629838.1 hypothetical protein [Moheibacter lacus]
MMKKWGICLLAAGLFLTACSSDDDNNEVSQEDQNQVDDEAIVNYLEDHYFEPERGLIRKYDDEDEADDAYPNLKSMGVKLNSGVWVIKRPGVTAEGPSITSNTQDSIQISYDSNRFIASRDNVTEGSELYGSVGTYYNTINSTGVAAWDPIFYYTEITEDLADNDINLDHFVIEGFVEGLKEFNSTQTSGDDLYNFQGAIIVPSRAAYGRDFVYTGGQLRNDVYRNTSFIFNFELHQFLPRNN